MNDLLIRPANTLSVEMFSKEKNLLSLPMSELDSSFKFAVDNYGRQFVQVSNPVTGEKMKFGFVLAYVEYDGHYKELRFRCVDPGKKHLELSLHA